MRSQIEFFKKTQKLIQDDYLLRQKKKQERKYKPKDDEVDMECPPIPDYHFAGKLYCPECTREHSLLDCPKQKKGHNNSWELEGNPAFLKGKARRMARFKLTDRNTTKLGSYSKSKQKVQTAIKNESKVKREQIEQ
jgi:hypothetical protein